jgi:hypothetical protein
LSCRACSPLWFALGSAPLRASCQLLVKTLRSKFPTSNAAEFFQRKVLNQMCSRSSIDESDDHDLIIQASLSGDQLAVRTLLARCPKLANAVDVGDVSVMSIIIFSY